MAIFDFIETSYDKLNAQLKNWLKAQYSTSDIVFTEASAYGQIMRVDEELFAQNIIYNKNSVNQISIDTATEDRIITNLARISGHNPTRPLSATGTVTLKLKVGVDIANQIKGSKLKIMNRTQLKNKTNNLYYNILLGSDFIIYDINPDVDIPLNVIQGRFDKASFTGQGTKGQSFNVNITGINNIENFNFAVYYNGILLSNKAHMYDMLPNEYACYTKTGFNGGLDIYFGTGDYGFVPAVGSIIEVLYILSDGKNGNILNNKMNDFTFIGEFYDNDGNTLNMDTLFNIFITDDITFGSDKENKVFTKNVIPHVSRNFVLSTPDQFIYQLQKLNIFSLINAYNILDKTNVNDNTYINSFITDVFGVGTQITISDSKGSQKKIDRSDIMDRMKQYFPNITDNIIYLYLIPNIKNYFVNNYNYFNVPYDAFYLDEAEKLKVLNYLRMLGNLSLTINVKIIDPIISRYVVNVYVRKYETETESNLRNNIIQVISDHFINNTRYDRIVKSEIIAEIKNQITGIDSVNLDFISKKNEDYHGDYIKSSANTNVSNTNNITLLEPTAINPDRYDPNKTLGIDPVLGDIIAERNEIMVLRGGFYDRNGIYFNDIPILNGLSTINIVWM